MFSPISPPKKSGFLGKLTFSTFCLPNVPDETKKFKILKRNHHSRLHLIEPIWNKIAYLGLNDFFFENPLSLLSYYHAPLSYCISENSTSWDIRLHNLHRLNWVWIANLLQKGSFWKINWYFFLIIVSHHATKFQKNP